MTKNTELLFNWYANRPKSKILKNLLELVELVFKSCSINTVTRYIRIPTDVSGFPGIWIWIEPFPPPIKPKLSKNKNINVNKDEYLRNKFFDETRLRNKKFKKVTKKIISVK